ncbi:hypothetical protein ACLBPY_28175, partial [Klebsiella pneumoniae]
MKLISHDLQDGGKLPNRHVFNGTRTARPPRSGRCYGYQTR